MGEMKRTAGISLLGLLLMLPGIEAKKHERERDQVTVVFSETEVRTVREHYREHPNSLPPGLQKKLARGGTLPPGWRKKIAPLPVELERRLPPPPSADCRRGYIEGQVVLYNMRTNVVLDVVALFGHR